jgi:hypothetical protein
MTILDHILEIISRLRREADPGVCVMLFNVQHDI